MDAIPEFISSIQGAVQNLVDDVLSFDPSTFNWMEVNWSGWMLGTVITAITLLVITAQLTDKGIIPRAKGPADLNVATGSRIVHRDDAPPIPPPTEVVSLRIYPIKSCRGIEIASTRLRKTGLTLDRNWMFITKDDKKFLTIRGESSMTLIDTAIVEGEEKGLAGQQLTITVHGTDKSVSIPAFPTPEWLQENTTLETVNIWGQDTDGYIYRDAINQPFSDFFKRDVQLVYKGPTSRMVAINGRKELYGQDVPHHFADVMSLQVATEASLKDLNRRLAAKSISPLTIERFRPNIIVRGRDDHPWEEDTWKRIRLTTRLPSETAIYKLDLDVVARCARCQVPNVDPDTAEKHPKEPWDELMKFRRVDDGGPAKYKPCFGMMCIPKNEGKIEVGAVLEVLETTDKHHYNVAAFKNL